MSSSSLPFGFKNGVLVHIETVPAGLACGCNCPSCLAPLIAKKGKIKVHHFAHRSGADCPHGLETVLHLYAKEVLSKANRIHLPALESSFFPKPLRPAATLQASEAILQKRLSQHVPDLLLLSGGRWYQIEIAVTHFTGPEKIKALAAAGMPALEIDVQALAQDMTIYKKPFDRISFERILLEDTHYKKWLYHPARQSAEAYIVRNSRQKKVYHRIYHQRHFFNVANCPLRKQVNRSSGSAYADVVQHCMHCNYCSGIRYQPAGAPPASLGSKPESLLCWAENAESMLKKFRMDIL